MGKIMLGLAIAGIGISLISIFISAFALYKYYQGQETVKRSITLQLMRLILNDQGQYFILRRLNYTDENIRNNFDHPYNKKLRKDMLRFILVRIFFMTEAEVEKWLERNQNEWEKFINQNIKEIQQEEQKKILTCTYCPNKAIKWKERNPKLWPHYNYTACCKFCWEEKRKNNRDWK